MEKNSSYSLLFLTEFTKNSSPLHFVLNTIPGDYPGLMPTTTFNFVSQVQQIDTWLKSLSFKNLKHPVAVIEANYNLKSAFEITKIILPHCPDNIKHIVFCLVGQRDSITVSIINDLSQSNKKKIRQTDYDLCIKETIGLLEDYITNGD